MGRLPHLPGGLDTARTWDAVIATEPALGVRLSKQQFQMALLAVADFVDLKSPYMLGHAGAVSALAGAAGEQLGLAAGDVETGARLVISPKTARNHIEHIYAKIGATSRVRASLFAMQHGLLTDNDKDNDNERDNEPDNEPDRGAGAGG